MGRPASFSQKEVARIATRLIGQGKNPTVDSVHEELGRRGSRTTVNNYLRAFREEFKARGLTALPSAIPEPLLPIIEDFWAQALVKAGERYDEERQSVEREREAEREANRVSLDETAAIIDEQSALLKDREQFVAEQARTISEQEQQVKALKSLLSGHDETILDLKRDKSRLSDQLDHEREDANRRFDQAKEDWYRERATLRQSVEDARRQLAEDNEKNARLADHWMLQLDDARQQVREIKERHQEDKQRWDADLKLERARSDRLAVTVSKYEQRIEALEAESSDVSKQFDAAVAENGVLKDQIAKLEGKLKRCKQIEG
ncbi:DNA-binding protein [Marinobacter goseongensis]|uniref:DNA-binding protein n=1 Tax=Marinobacter goseongensis TaxID=453838 RepID=UPI0020069379|nr:DNA-binding protein [Marinobacter goseongensis]MCK7553302.1 DNA-binding protein [Marinobacter goseongensis]